MTASSDGELLPGLGENATALSLGFYQGFLAWVGFSPPSPEDYREVPENGWYYAGYMIGWVVKLGLLIGLGDYAIMEGIIPIG